MANLTLCCYVRAPCEYVMAPCEYVMAPCEPAGDSDGAYPGSAGLKLRAEQGGRAHIHGNLGRSRITASMSMRFLFPEPRSWRAGQRKITCFIFDSGQMTSSLIPSATTG